MSSESAPLEAEAAAAEEAAPQSLVTTAACAGCPAGAASRSDMTEKI